MIEKYLTQQNTLLLIAVVSLFSLGAALFAEAILKLEPCILCVYQRIPFVVAFLLAGVALLMRNPRADHWILKICGLGFLINSGIAFYHSGVELKWWKSAVEGCSVPSFDDSNTQSMLENILSAPTGNCSEIPWADPILGLSMANYNVVLCFGLFLLCSFTIWRTHK